MAQTFKRFSEIYEFQHITISPGYSQSNGKTESAVQTAKTLLEELKQAFVNKKLVPIVLKHVMFHMFTTVHMSTTRTVESLVKTTSPSTSIHSTELEDYIPTHSTPQHQAQSPSASEMRTDTHQTPTRSDTGYTTRFGRQVKPPSHYQ